MDINKKLFIMRNLFAGLQAETIARYAKGGILNEIEKERMELSLASGEKNAKILEVTEPVEAITIPASIVDCASWEVTRNKDGLIAVCEGCKLAAMCKKIGTPSPCRMYCLNAIEGMIKVLKPEAVFIVKSTLWSEENCTVEVAW